MRCPGFRRRSAASSIRRSSASSTRRTVAPWAPSALLRTRSRNCRPPRTLPKRSSATTSSATAVWTPTASSPTATKSCGRLTTSTRRSFAVGPASVGARPARRVAMRTLRLSSVACPARCGPVSLAWRQPPDSPRRRPCSRQGSRRRAARPQARRTRHCHSLAAQPVTSGKTRLLGRGGADVAGVRPGQEGPTMLNRAPALRRDQDA
mmetsp:Transcript_62808/g.202598  ORF Transcript_62808/g.202598 Transcript_62808/m.202598 type:complete len:207 (-) Transcript_62808:152-772(-)